MHPKLSRRLECAGPLAPEALPLPSGSSAWDLQTWAAAVAAVSLEPTLHPFWEVQHAQGKAAPGAVAAENGWNPFCL